MRLAVIGTPRSGNSLLRKLLAGAYGLAEAASHDPEYLLGELPANSVMQVHAQYTTRIARSLADQNVIVISPRRHPLDVLLSMLHFAQFEPDVAMWLGGDYLADLGGCDPTSRSFAEFATGPGAAELLAVSAAWRAHADVAVEFSALAENPMSVLHHEGLGAHRIIGDPRLLRTAASFDRFHRTENMHGWLGRSDHWPTFIARSLAEDIYDAQEAVFRLEGYSIAGAEDLDVRQVRMAWAEAFAGRSAVDARNPAVDGRSQAVESAVAPAPARRSWSEALRPRR